jgi:hypothetical protein
MLSSNLQKWAINFCLSPQMAIPQILGLIQQSQIRKFLRHASPQTANPQIFMLYLQIANLQVSTEYCTTLSQNNPKSRLFKGFL